MPESATLPGPGAEAIYGWSAADAVGALGLALYIGSFLALQLGLIRGVGYLYAFLNLLAASCVLVSLLEHFNLFAAIIQSAWILISIIGIARLYLVHRYLSLTGDERAAAHRLVPRLPKDRVRKLLAQGAWTDAVPGHVLATEGRPVENLVFVAEGVCRIEVGGVTVATVGPGGIIGEMTYLTGQPATATVIVETPARLLAFDRRRLGAFLDRHEDIGAELEQGIAGDLRGKLAATSRALAEGRAETDLARADDSRPA